MRDITQRQFQAALTRHEFRSTGLGWFEDTSGKSTSAYGGVFHPRTFKLLRRATLQHIIAERDEVQS